MFGNTKQDPFCQGMGRPGERTARPSKKNLLLQPIMQLRNGHSTLSKGKMLFFPLPYGKAPPKEHGQLPITTQQCPHIGGVSSPESSRGCPSAIISHRHLFFYSIHLFFEAAAGLTLFSLRDGRQPRAAPSPLPTAKPRPRGSWATARQNLHPGCQSRIQ